MKRKTVYRIKSVVIISLAALASAVSLELFLLPSNVVIGGALGVASILDILLTNNMDRSLWYMSAGIWSLVINIPVFVYCFRKCRFSFALRTTLYVSCLSLFLIVLRLTGLSQVLDGVISSNSPDDRVVFVIIGGALHGVSLPMVLTVNCSTGGSDIVGLVVQKHLRKTSSFSMRAILLTNVVVVLLSSVAYGLVRSDVTAAVNMFIYSVSAMLVCEIVQESIFKGFSAALELEITTDKVEEMRQALLDELKHGVTSVKVVGGYSRQEKSMLLCVINRGQLTLARRIIHRVDPMAFAYVENVKEVIGKGFDNIEGSLTDGEDVENKADEELDKAQSLK